MELQLKQLDCELLIRKKEALRLPQSHSPAVFIHSPPPPVMPAATPEAFAAASSPSPSAVSPSPPSKSVKSSLPPLKCPMAGTFYRSPAPGEPSFVKVYYLYLVAAFYMNNASFIIDMLSILVRFLLLIPFNTGWRQSAEGAGCMHH